MPQSGFHDFEYNFWKNSAKSYHDGFGAITAQMANHVLDAVQCGPGKKLLDVASGPGYVAAVAQQQGAMVTGIDFSADMVTLAASIYPDINFQVADAQALPFEEGQFDGVVCNFGIMHLSEPEMGFAEAFRICKIGGHYAFTVWDKPENSKALEIIFNAIKDHGVFDVGLPEGPAFFKFSEPAEAAKSLQTAGFHGVQSTKISLSWTFESTDKMIAAFYNGGARIGGVLRAQKPEALEKIKADVKEKLLPFKMQNGFSVPVQMLMTAGKK